MTVADDVAALHHTLVISKYEADSDVHDALTGLFGPHLPVPADRFDWGFEVLHVGAFAGHDGPGIDAFAKTVASLNQGQFTEEPFGRGDMTFRAIIRIADVPVWFELIVPARDDPDRVRAALTDRIRVHQNGTSA